MACNNENTIIVFHSYPSKPCIDGLMSAIITSTLYEKTNVTLVPYWRIEDSFNRLKKAVDEVGIDKTTIVYVDCSPELEKEVDFLLSILPNVPVNVYDHHPRSAESEMNRLMGKNNFNFVFDSDNCAAIMTYHLLNGEQKQRLNIDELLQVVQFSEYEGMNPKVAGKEEAGKISKNAFTNAMKSKVIKDDEESVKNLNTLITMDLCLFYVLDQILSKEEDWKFFYNKELSNKEIVTFFLTQTSKYLSRTREVLSGNDVETFGKDTTKSYIKTLDKLPKIFSTGVVFSDTIGKESCNIYAVNISIFEFGRVLEPLVREELKKKNASYGVLMNPSTKNNKGEVSHYFSLRRVNEEFDARDLVAFIKNVTGTKIGGGHPWGSGVNLNEEQYKTFLRLGNI